MNDTIIKQLKSVGKSGLYLLLGLLIGWFVFSGSNTIENKPLSQNTEEIWTCSMHPQIRQHEPGACPICGMDLIPLTAGDNEDPIQLVMTPEAVKLAEVETMIVGANSAAIEGKEKELFLTGKVKMDQTLERAQTAHIAGRIEQLMVRYDGEMVRKNQKIAVIYSPELVSAQKELLEALKTKKDYPELYQAARQKIRQWKLPESTIDAIEKKGLIQEQVTIFAERSGRVMKRYVAEGDYVKKGSPLFDIMDLNRVWVLFDVYEKDLEWVKVGTTVEFNLEAMPQKTYRSRIKFIDPILNPKTRTVAARVELSNTNGLLKPDMFAKGLIRIAILEEKTKKEPLIIPKTAVLWTGERSVAYLKVPDLEVPTFEFRELVLGADLGTSFVIKEGIAIGDEVVVNGAFRLDAAAQLSNKKSMMNRWVSIKKDGEKMAEELPNYSAETEVLFQQQLADLVEQYLKLKDGLIATDFEAAQQANLLMKERLVAMDWTLLKADALKFGRKNFKKMNSIIEQLEQAKNIEIQRAVFSDFSKRLIKLVKVYGLPEGTLFVQHCPMALDDKGGDWLSREEQVKNPYFGDKMLKCGLVNDSLVF
ncbi:efflux RND transporter periplasmic adaptor subunit [Aureispira anguillae]|uniref:Efflux RND transporter periplasmic adaptor subunit n=1 Tax=Aureispira anguillae TaxID=2864201 RepID=A0A915Y9U6_9BACT|nr:efflux RND transporter periplasmic adaptor subunit [Aureispira anguillae]BDS09434.1 efflux RND transporter periplasmic adaptor subunit [Aureispira anguillae]